MTNSEYEAEIVRLKATVLDLARFWAMCDDCKAPENGRCLVVASQEQTINRLKALLSRCVPAIEDAKWVASDTTSYDDLADEIKKEVGDDE